jgi:hypothetical protein
MPHGTQSEQVERIFVEHVSFLYKTLILSVVFCLVAIAAAIIVGIWWIALLGLLGFLPAYFKLKRRNRYIITNERFIRELYNPHHNMVAVPLKSIVGIKLLSRATDKYGTVRVETTPEYGDQLLVDGQAEYGVIMCHKIPDHAAFSDIRLFARDVAAQRS